MATDPSAIASVDLGAFLHGTADQRQSIAAQVDEICRSTGFLIVDNHGVPDGIVDNAWSLTSEFFDLPQEQKLAARSEQPGCPRGYFPMAAEALGKSLGVDTPPDLKESFGIGPSRAPERRMSAEDFDFHFGNNLWPRRPKGFRDAWLRYFRAMENLADGILTLFAAALDLPPDYFAPFHTHPISAMRGLRYPLAQPGLLLPGQKGAGEHSDYGSITILKPDPAVAGLEIRLPAGQWARVPLVKNGFIINIGDMLARWTNDRWVSTLHRVVMPAQLTDDSQVARQSIAFFYNTNYDAEIRCIPTCLDSAGCAHYDPVIAGEYLMQRFRSAI